MKSALFDDALREVDLRLVQSRIDPAGFEQLFMPADLGNSSSFENHQSIGFAQGTQAVSDRDRRATLHEIIQRRLNLTLGLGVDR